MVLMMVTELMVLRLVVNEPGMVGCMIAGNSAGMAIGQPTATSVDFGDYQLNSLMMVITLGMVV